MDPIAAISTVANIAVAIKTWVDDQADKDDVILEVGQMVARLSNILDHLSMKASLGEIDLVVAPQILSLGSVLTKTLQDIQSWTPRKLGLRKVVATLVPRKVIEIIREDERRIMQQMIILMFALSATGHHPESSRPAEDNSKPNALKWIRNPEVADFWGTYVGRQVITPKYKSTDNEVFFVRTTDFKAALQLWYSKQLEEAVLNHIIYRLDEFDIGGVNVTALDDFAGTKSLRLLIAAYAHQASNPVPILVSTPSTADDSITLPLVVWIDDNPDNNAFEIQMAKNLGVEVITLLSTGEAKIWIDLHFGIINGPCNT